MLTRKSLMTLIVAGLAVAPAAAFAYETFEPSKGEASFTLRGAQYERVNGEWKRVDIAPAKSARGDVSGFVGTSEQSAAPRGPVYKNLQEKVDTEMRHGSV